MKEEASINRWNLYGLIDELRDEAMEHAGNHGDHATNICEIPDCKETEDSTNSHQDLLSGIQNLTGNRTKVLCVDQDQCAAISDILKEADTGGNTITGPERIILAASLVQLATKSDCDRCINETCEFRRAKLRKKLSRAKDL